MDKGGRGREQESIWTVKRHKKIIKFYYGPFSNIRIYLFIYRSLSNLCVSDTHRRTDPRPVHSDGLSSAHSSLHTERPNKRPAKCTCNLMMIIIIIMDTVWEEDTRNWNIAANADKQHFNWCKKGDKTRFCSGTQFCTHQGRLFNHSIQL